MGKVAEKLEELIASRMQYLTENPDKANAEDIMAFFQISMMEKQEEQHTCKGCTDPNHNQ